MHSLSRDTLRFGSPAVVDATHELELRLAAAALAFDAIRHGWWLPTEALLDALSRLVAAAGRWAALLEEEAA